MMPVIAPEVIAAAQSAERTYGILSSVQLAQFGIESGWGKLCTGRFNYFGVKAGPTQPGTLCPTHEYVGGQRVAVMAKFRDYASIADAFAEHACLLATAGPYAKARLLRSDFRGFANALTGVYATDPNYGAELIKIIEGDDLTRYDAAINASTTVAAHDPITASNDAVNV